MSMRRYSNSKLKTIKTKDSTDRELIVNRISSILKTIQMRRRLLRGISKKISKTYLTNRFKRGITFGRSSRIQKHRNRMPSKRQLTGIIIQTGMIKQIQPDRRRWSNIGSNLENKWLIPRPRRILLT